LQSSNDKIYSVINYRPQVSLEEALRRTIKWFEDNGRKWPWERSNAQGCISKADSRS
jgi:dTDP-D-glucose 4,6-dehydratase